MTVHVVGAGLAGLAAAVAVAAAGRPVVLHEAAGQAGGRCRSLDDPVLGRTIDNGNHLLLSGNDATMAYLARIGAGDALVGPASARFPFVDLADGTRWTLDLGRGRFPWWLLDPRRRVPGASISEHLGLLRLWSAPAEATVAAVIPPDHPLYRPLVEPLAVAVLNAPPEQGAAALLGPVLRRTLFRGGRASRPLVARHGLSAAFVDPALAWLRARGATVRLGARLRRLVFVDDTVAALDFGDGAEVVATSDPVILAVPPSAAAALVPALRPPEAHAAILNAHFRIEGFVTPDGPPFLGVLGGMAQWLFFRGDVVSVTVSAADLWMEHDAEALAAPLWRDVATALALPEGPPPPWRIVKERRATFAQTPAALARRPDTGTPWRNLFLAGDWTRTGLPATIEGAVRSGDRAAAYALGRPI